MTLLDRFLFVRMLQIGFFAMLVFTLCWLAPEILFKAVQGVASHQLTLGQGGQYLLYQVPEVMTYCLPIAGLFASVFLFRQISLSSELTAILASGISFRRLLVPVMGMGILVSGVLFLTQEYGLPWAAVNRQKLTQETRFEPGTLVTPQISYVEKSPAGTMRKFLLISPTARTDQNQFIFLMYDGEGRKTHLNRIVTANAGRWDADVQAWDLHDGVEYRLSPEGIYNQVGAFARHRVKTSPVAHELLTFPNGRPAEFSIALLARYVRLLDRGGQTENAQFYRIRLLQRYVLVWAPLLLAALGAAIGIERSRARRNLGLTYAAGLLLFYNIMVPTATTLGSIGFLPLWLAVIFPLALTALAGVGIVKLRRSEG